MKPTAYDFKEFYASPIGAHTADAVAGVIAKWWPDMKDRRVMVYGYGMPYGTLFSGTDRIVYLMPPDQGAFPWPDDKKNLVALSARTSLPLETSSLDGVVLIHSLEFTNAVEPHLNEIWRVLKSNGRLIVVVPNRVGFWSRVDWAPFGQGTPFSLSQLNRYLRDALFTPEKKTTALYAVPIRWAIFLRLSRLLEKYGRYIYPGLAGLHIVEASKQVYAGLAIPVRATAKVKGNRVLVPTTHGSQHQPHQ
jgi:SAM-dependent methyltransferase